MIFPAYIIQFGKSNDDFDWIPGFRAGKEFNVHVIIGDGETSGDGSVIPAEVVPAPAGGGECGSWIRVHGNNATMNFSNSRIFNPGGHGVEPDIKMVTRKKTGAEGGVIPAQDVEISVEDSVRAD